MITILTATPRHGYTGYDHMMTGRECDTVIGQSFRLWRDAAAAVDAAFRANRLDARLRPVPPITVEARVGSGDVVKRTI